MCIFANVDDGYISYSIGVDAVMAGALVGIPVSNLNCFELDCRNELRDVQSVMCGIE